MEAGLPQAAQWLAAFKGKPEYAAARATYIDTLAKTDPGQALTFTLSETPENSGLAQRIILDCAAERPELATNLVDKIKTADQMRVTVMLGEIIAANPAYDPFKWLDDRLATQSEIFEQKLDSLVVALAKRAPARAMEWLEKLPEAKRDDLGRRALVGWMYNDAKAVLGWLNEHPDKSALKKLSHFDPVAFSEPEGFAQWVAKLPPGDLQNSARSELATHAAVRGSLAEAVKYFPANATGQEFSYKANEFGYRLAKSSPQEAVRWLETLPEGELQQQGVLGVLGQWTERSPAEAAQWVDNLPPGALRDGGAAAFVKILANKDFENANAWLSEVRSRRIRDEIVANIFRSQQTMPRAEAQAWLLALPNVSETVRKRLLNAWP